MNATKNHIGKNKATQRKAATDIISTVRNFRPLASKTKNFKRNAERQTAIRTDSATSNGFLKCSFLPKQEEITVVQDYREVENMERGFYKTLSKISKQYKVNPMQTKDFGFPYNVALAIWDLEIKIKLVNEDWTQFRLIRHNQEIHFASEERFDMGTTLYFIPIVPLFQMLHDKKRQKNAQLLLSVFSYLYHIADVPYYRQESSYLHWIYEMHEEWLEQEDEAEEDLQEYGREFIISKNVGDIIERKLFNTKNLHFFEQRLSCFKVRNEFDQDCKRVAYEAFDIYLKYPKTTIFQNKPSSEEDPYNDDDSNKTIGMEKYISFVANTKGCLYRNIEDSLNSEFNEYGSIEEPTIYTPIRGTTIPKADFDFENRFFTLIEDLHKVLTD